MHLRIDQKQEKGKPLIKSKCGKTTGMTLDNTTIWYSDVDCVDCRPYRFLPVDDNIGGLKMFRVDGQPDDTHPTVDLTKVESTPKVRTLRRRPRRG
jgi:hypothetical protein